MVGVGNSVMVMVIGTDAPQVISKDMLLAVPTTAIFPKRDSLSCYQDPRVQKESILCGLSTRDRNDGHPDALLYCIKRHASEYESRVNEQEKNCLMRSKV